MKQSWLPAFRRNIQNTREIKENAFFDGHVLSSFVQWKSVLFNLLCVLDLNTTWAPAQNCRLANRRKPRLESQVPSLSILHRVFNHPATKNKPVVPRRLSRCAVSDFTKGTPPLERHNPSNSTGLAYPGFVVVVFVFFCYCFFFFWGGRGSVQQRVGGDNEVTSIRWLNFSTELSFNSFQA